MKNSIVSTLALVAVLVSGAAMAQTAVSGDTTVPGHPRENEINQRLQEQQNRTDNGVKDGQIGAKQEMHDQNLDNKVAHQESVDEAKHNGHLTKHEEAHMNKELNKDSSRIHRQRHPIVEKKVPPSAPVTPAQ